MKRVNRLAIVMTSWLIAVSTSSARGQDWPQWRGTNRDGKVTGFTPPAEWPKTLAPKWKTTVGDGVSTPALVGDKVYCFARQDNNEVISCLDAASGKEVWRDQYPAQGASGPAASFSGPRASPAVADGKVVTLGVNGLLSCRDAATGKKIWQKDDFQGSGPRFFTASSPIVVNGLCVAQLGGEGNGGMIAYDLGTGEQKWKWTGDGPGYASPVLATIGETPLIVAETSQKIVALQASDGKLVWETPFAAQGMGAYNAATPVVDGQTIVFSGGAGRGTRAVKLEKSGDGFSARELWSNQDGVQFNSPIAKDGFIYGLTQGNELFCINEQNGQTAWKAQVGTPGQAPQAGPGGRPGGGPGAGGPGGPGGRRGRGGMRGGGRGGYGSIVDAGAVLFALTPSSQLVVFDNKDQAFHEIARIKVADSPTYAYPIISGKHAFIKDQDAVSMLEIE